MKKSFKPIFNEIKATEALAYLLKLAGGEMRYLKAIKLLYMSDRKALEEWGTPITFDSFVSMEYGQVGSNFYDLIKIKKTNNSVLGGDNISISNYDLNLKNEIPPKKLSKGELHFIKWSYDNFKDENEYEFTHQLPEYKETKSSIPTNYEDLLKHLHFSDEEISEIIQDLDERCKLNSIL